MTTPLQASRHLTACPLDCPGSCPLVVTVADGRLVRVQGDVRHPFSRGIICGKVSRYADLQEGPRLTTPLIRTGAKGSGQFRPATWEEALERVTGRLRTILDRFGPAAIWPYYYGGTMGVVQRSAVARLTHRAGFSRNHRTLCSSIGFAGWRAGVGNRVWGPAPEEIAESDLVILWGIDPVTTHVTLMSWVNQARRQGARLVVVDPVVTRTARLADSHLAPRPGTDGALAVAVMHELLVRGEVDREYLARWSDFDAEVEDHLHRRSPEWAAPITGLAPEAIRTLAAWLGRSRRPFFRLGFGMTRQGNGAVNLHAVTCLPTLTGGWRERGGGALLSTSGAFAVDDGPVQRPDWAAPGGRFLDMSRLGRILTDPQLDPPVAALLVMNANPAVSSPESREVWRGLMRDDLLTVVHELVMSETARFADVVLPATTFLEQDDLYKSYGHYTLHYAPRVLPPRGEAWSNHRLVNALAQGLGWTDPDFAGEEGAMVAQVAAASGLPPPGSWPDQRWDCTPSEDDRHFRRGFPQPDGRFHFYPGWKEMPRLPDHWPVNQRDRGDLAGRYPLDLVLPPHPATLNSSFAGVARERRGEARLWIHPEDARVRAVEEGGWVVVWNDQARLTLRAEVTTRVRPGLCLCEIGWLPEAVPEGLPLNALTHSDATLPDGGAAFHDNRVEVAAIAGA